MNPTEAPEDESSGRVRRSSRSRGQTGANWPTHRSKARGRRRRHQWRQRTGQLGTVAR